MTTTWIDEMVPSDLRLALGDLVISAADLEGIAYDVARVFRIERPETASAKRVLGLIQARAGEVRMPPWSGTELRKVLAWCRASTQMLEQRDRIIHASMHFAGRHGEPALVPVRTSLRTGEPIESEAEHVRSVVTYLLRVRRIGVIVLHDLHFPAPDGQGRVLPSYIPMPGFPHHQPYDLPDEWARWIEAAEPIQRRGRQR